MTPTDRESIRVAIRELKGDVCKSCNGTKRQMQSFCFRCYRRLTIKLQKDLYKTIADGYAEVYNEAKQYLAAGLTRYQGNTK